MTHAAIIGKFGFPLIFNVIWILTYGSTLERSVYSIHPEEYLFMLLFGTGAMAVMSLIAGPLLHLAWFTISGKAIVMMMVYVWSKNFPEQVRPGGVVVCLLDRRVRLPPCSRRAGMQPSTQRRTAERASAR